jgi:hypothetical protein
VVVVVVVVVLVVVVVVVVVVHYFTPSLDFILSKFIILGERFIALLFKILPVQLFACCITKYTGLKIKIHNLGFQKAVN